MRPTRALTLALCAIGLALLAPVAGAAQAQRVLWVSPAAGSDYASGATRAHALRTLTAAWHRAHGPTRILLTGGRVPAAAAPTYYEAKRGVTIEGVRRTELPPLNMYRLSNFALVNVSVAGDVHCELCDGLRVSRVIIRGGGRVQEGLKVNQSSNVTVEHSDISGAWDNSVDFVAVEHALLRDNHIHHAQDWCAYAKGGSAYIRVVSNRIDHCGTGGFTAGQGSGLQFMRFPWVRYEAYDVRVWNNLISDTEGAGLGVNGGFDVLFARNTLLRVGRRSHALEVVFGSRSCDGRPGDEGRGRCAALIARGAWGTTVVDDGDNYVRIPNRHVWFYDNVVVKARGAETMSVSEARRGSEGAASHVPNPARADDDLRVVGNVVSTTRPGRGPAHVLPSFSWAGAGLGAPRPSSLSNRRLSGLSHRAGSMLSPSS